MQLLHETVQERSVQACATSCTLQGMTGWNQLPLIDAAGCTMLPKVTTHRAVGFALQVDQLMCGHCQSHMYPPPCMYLCIWCKQHTQLVLLALVEHVIELVAQINDFQAIFGGKSVLCEVAGAVVGHHLCHDTAAQHREVLKQHAVLASFMHTFHHQLDPEKRL